jgi:hypothetical protein
VAKISFEIDLHERLSHSQTAKKKMVNKLLGRSQYMILNKKQKQTEIEKQKLMYKNFLGRYVNKVTLDMIANEWWYNSFTNYQKIVWLTPKQVTLLLLQDYEVSKM